MKKYDYPDLKETYVYPQKIIFNKYFIFKIGSQQLCINFDFWLEYSMYNKLNKIKNSLTFVSMFSFMLKISNSTSIK